MSKHCFSRKMICRLFGAALAVSVCSRLSAADEPITVRLSSGRQYTAHVDHKTDENRLVLRFEGDATTLLRPIAWPQIEQAWHDDQDIPSDELVAFAQRIKSTRQSPLLHAPLPPADAPHRADGRSHAEQVQQSMSSPPKVSDLYVEAKAANWRQGVELDGLELNVSPLDANGDVVPVSGTLTAELIVARPVATGGRYTHARGKPFPRVGRWGEALRAADVGPNGARFRLPFQAMHPEFDLSLAPHGLVHVQLAVPGSGVYNRTVDLVRVRPYSVTRDRLEQLDGRRRFFRPEEQLDRTH